MFLLQQLTYVWRLALQGDALSGLSVLFVGKSDIGASEKIGRS